MQYRPPRGPTQTLPPLQGHSPSPAVPRVARPQPAGATHPFALRFFRFARASAPGAALTAAMANNLANSARLCILSPSKPAAHAVGDAGPSQYPACRMMHYFAQLIGEKFSIGPFHPFVILSDWISPGMMEGAKFNVILVRSPGSIYCPRPIMCRSASV